MADRRFFAEKGKALCLSLLRAYPFILILALWEFTVRLRVVSPLLLPPLEKVGAALVKFYDTGDLWYHGSATLLRALIGFGLAVVVGLALGALLARSRLASRLFEPIFFFGNPVPKIALYPVFVFMFGLGDLSKIVLIFLECLYPITIQTLFGIRNTPRVLVRTAQNFGASKRALFWNVLLPSASPAIFTGLRTALPVSLILTVITEIIGENRGLGHIVAFAAASFEPDRAMAAVAIVGTAGVAFDRIITLLRRRVVFWQTA